MRPRIHIMQRLLEAYEYRGDPEYARALMKVLWRVILACAFLTVAAMVWRGAVLLREVWSDDEDQQQSAAIERAAVNELQLSGVIDAQRLRKERSDAISPTSVRFDDPSRVR